MPNGESGNVQIEVRTLAFWKTKVVVKSYRYFVNLVGPHQCYFHCTLPKATYRFFVYAKDRAGNNQVTPGSNTLIVY